MEPLVTDTTTSITSVQDTTTNADFANTTEVPAANMHGTAEKHTEKTAGVNPTSPSSTTPTKTTQGHWSSAEAQAKYDPNAKLVSQNARTETASVNPTMLSSIQFEEVTYNYGTIKAGDKINHTFRFKNTGNVPLEIENAEGSCGCTQPVYPFIPINPGQTGEIKVAFNSLGKAGKVQTKVTITANTAQKTHYVFLEGDVVAKDPTSAKTDSTKVKS